MAACVNGFQKITSNQEKWSFATLLGGGNISLINWPASQFMRRHKQQGGPHILTILSTPVLKFYREMGGFEK